MIIWFVVSCNFPAAGYSGERVLIFIIAFAGIVNSVSDGCAEKFDSVIAAMDPEKTHCA